ncbi:hypothetical protein [Streptomyces rubrogriseus]|uniref:hypothetical protein n=1 Tax=Streptomyces rubrogriseus TaxID=194673 RepID=UPI003818FAB6
MTTLDLTLLGSTHKLTAKELAPITSAHSGNPLRRYALEFRVPDSRRSDMNAELQAAATPNGQHLRGSDAAWRVAGSWTATSQAERPDIYTYALEVQEVEELQASTVELGGLALVPIQYMEESNDEGTIAATFVTEVSGEASDRLEELLSADDEYYDVVRRGVNDTALRMRFGRCLWQQVDGGVRRHNLVLVADEGQPEGSLPPMAVLNQPQLHRTTEKTVANADALALLLDELLAQGVLSEKAFNMIKAAATPHALTHRESREFSRTENLDDYWR